MIRTTFQTDDVCASERLDYWRELVSRAHAPIEVRSAHANEFYARQSMLEVGAVQVWDVECLPFQTRRTPRLIRTSDPGVICMMVTLDGTLCVNTAGRANRFGVREWSLHDTAHPFEMAFHASDGQPYRGLAVMIPKALLSLSPGSLQRMVGARVPARHGVGALLTDSLVRMTSDSGSYQLNDGPRLASVLIDLGSAVVANVLDADERSAPASRPHVLAVRIRAYIQQHLHDPDLTPGTVAAAHHISISYLHRLFRGHDTTVSAWIRRQRLERARRDLSDPTWRSTPVHRIATRWGYTYAADFTRAFSAAYGLAPSEYRRVAIRP